MVNQQHNPGQNPKKAGWERFIYVSEVIQGSGRRERRLEQEWQSPIESAPPTSERSLRPLIQVAVGDRARIVALNCGTANNRFIGMGLAPGAVVQVISSTATGSVILALRHQRLGLGAEIAKQIQVAIVDQVGAESNVISGDIPMTHLSAGMTVKLRDAAIGSALRVVGYEPTARDYKRKLLAMGLTPGTELVVKRHAPLGDPTEIAVRDFRLSLRKDEADTLIVEPA